MKFDWLMVTKKGKLNLKFVKVKGMQMQAHAFLQKLKSTFYGMICDFENHDYIDIEAKTIAFDSNTC